MPERLKLVFPSASAAAMMREDIGDRLRADAYSVIPNPIDTDLFRYVPKSEDMRFRILSIRPFDSPTRGNDLSVAAIRCLSGQPGFERVQFTLIGDGPVFEQELAPLSGLPNVAVHRHPCNVQFTQPMADDVTDHRAANITRD